MNTILVVDDRPDTRYATTRVLAGAGFDVRETATGRDALRLARTAPDLIVLDIALTDIDGFEVCRRHVGLS
jgi:CheY-like chemotaxis protein